MIKDLRLKIDRLKWERDEIKSEQKNLIKSILEKEDTVKSLELIKSFMVNLNNQVKSTIKTNIETIVNTGLAYIYDTTHDFKIVFVEKRKQQEVEFFLDGIQLKKPFIGKGGGKIVVVGLLLQLAFIEQFKLTNTIFLDEVGKMVDMRAIDKVAKFLKAYSVKFNKQLIFITHHEELEETADIVFKISKPKTVSEVQECVSV